MRRTWRVMLLLGLGMGWLTAGMMGEAHAARARLGARLGVYTDPGDLFVGLEVVAPLTRRLAFDPNLEYVFVKHADKLTFNFDFTYDFTGGRNYVVWLGGGLGAVYVNPEGRGEAHTDLGLNILFGAGFNVGKLLPYVQAKMLIADNSDFVVGFGLRF